MSLEVAGIDADGQLDLEGQVLRRLEFDILSGEAVAVDAAGERLAQGRS
jgi:hypothetical protein